MQLSDYEALDWDEEDDEGGNFQHCLGEDHLGNDPNQVVDELLAEQPIVSKVRVASAELAVTRPNADRNMLWTVVFATSGRRGDWLRPVTGWRARPAHIRGWEQATGERWRR
jgi:hypothetical protein